MTTKKSYSYPLTLKLLITILTICQQQQMFIEAAPNKPKPAPSITPTITPSTTQSETPTVSDEPTSSLSLTPSNTPTITAVPTATLSNNPSELPSVSFMPSLSECNFVVVQIYICSYMHFSRTHV